jgi:hypothetical protein
MIADPGSFPGTSRYQVLRMLGRGGMGVVYEALDRERDVRVALKTMRNLDAHALLRFKEEFRAIQGLEHPNLVSLFDLVSDGGRWFFTMELVDGQSFLLHVREVVRADDPPTAPDPFVPHGDPGPETQPLDDEAPSPPPEVWRAPSYDEARLRSALAQLARALAHLHAAGKVHRDVKPSNVMVARTGRVVLLDFGLVIDQSGRTDSGVVGTAEYMAPEQAVQRKVGPATDCYALGVMLYEVLAGQLPFRGSGFEVLQAKLGPPPRPPVAIAPCSADLNALAVDLLAVDPQARPTAQEILRRLGAGASAPPAKAASGGPAFVGRGAELAQLEAAFEQVRRGQPTLVLVEGPSGVGKSALVRQFARRLEGQVKDLVVLAGRYYEREVVPYRALDAIMDAIARFLMRLSDAEAEAVLPVDAGLLATLFPSLHGVEIVSRGGFRPPALDPQELRTRVHQAVRELFVRLSRRRPVVIILDDVQWSDRDSRAVLAEAMRPPDGPVVLALATLRTAPDDGSGSVRAQGFLGSLGGLERIVLGPLDDPEARALAGRLLGDADDVRAGAIAAEAQGHPLFIDALARHALQGGVTSVRLDDALQARIDALEAPARQLLELTALAGRPLPERYAQRALALDLPALSRAASALRLGHLVRMTRRRDEDALEPYHDRVREIVAKGVEKATRRRRYEQLARAHEAVESSDTEALFAYWRGAGDAARSVRYGALAAARASEVLAFDRAARLYRALVALTPEGEERRRLTVRLGEALAMGGRGPEAAGAYQRAGVGAPAGEALELGRRAAEQLLRSGRIDEGLAAVRVVLAAVGLEMPRTPRRALVGLLARRALLTLRGFGWTARDAAEIAQSELTRIDICWSVAGVLGMVDTIRGAYFQNLHLQLALRAGERFRVARALALEAAYSAASGVPNARRTGRFIGEAQKLAAGIDDAYTEGWVRGVAGVSAALEGRWRAALEQTGAAEDIFRTRCGGTAWELSTFQFFHIYGLAFTGQMRALARRVPQSLRDAEERGDRYAAAAHRIALANMAWLVGDDVAGARERAREAMAHWSRGGFQVEHFWEMLALGQIDLYAGEPAAAHERIGRAWPGLAASLLLRVQLTRVEAVHLRARVALAAGDLAAARAHSARIARERAPWVAPFTDLLRAGLAARSGDTETAAARLRRAVAGFDAADMALYAAAARDRLGALLGGDEGAALRGQAEAWMRAEGIAQPERMVRMLAPGLSLE